MSLKQIWPHYSLCSWSIQNNLTSAWHGKWTKTFLIYLLYPEIYSIVILAFPEVFWIIWKLFFWNVTPINMTTWNIVYIIGQSKTTWDPQDIENEQDSDYILFLFQILRNSRNSIWYHTVPGNSHNQHIDLIWWFDLIFIWSSTMYIT